MKLIPVGARWLGLAGLLPFLALSYLSVVESGNGVDDAQFALRAYGAVILSFLGGIQWGLAIRRSDGSPRSRQGLTPTLALSVVPSLIAWAGLLVAPGLGFGLLIGGFILVLMADVRAANRNMTPDWYLRLRYPLSGVVIACLVLVTSFGP